MIYSNTKTAVTTGTTDGAVVAAAPGRRIRVFAFILSAAATATACTFNTKPAGSGTAISAVFTVPVNNPFSPGFNPDGWFDTNVGEGLTLTTGTGSTVGVQVSYGLLD